MNSSEGSESIPPRSPRLSFSRTHLLARLLAERDEPDEIVSGSINNVEIGQAMSFMCSNTRQSLIAALHSYEPVAAFEPMLQRFERNGGVARIVVSEMASYEYLEELCQAYGRALKLAYQPASASEQVVYSALSDGTRGYHAIYRDGVLIQSQLRVEPALPDHQERLASLWKDITGEDIFTRNRSRRESSGGRRSS